MSFGQNRGYGNQGGFGRSFGSFKKPVEVGKEYNVTISDTSKRGEGIAKIDGFVIFVPTTKMGQSVRIKVTQVSERFASAQVIESSATTAPATTATAAAPQQTSESTPSSV